MKRMLVIAGFLMMLPLRPAAAFNLIDDVREKLVWTVGQNAQIGTAVKLAGSGDLEVGETATSFLAGIAEYRFLVFSYGGTRVNRRDADFTDTAKVGFRLNTFFGLFKNPPTSEMAFLQNVNIGPSFAFNMISSPHTGTLFLDLNYEFGGSK